jgi:hypothetical protein
MTQQLTTTQNAPALEESSAQLPALVVPALGGRSKKRSDRMTNDYLFLVLRTLEDSATGDRNSRHRFLEEEHINNAHIPLPTFALLVQKEYLTVCPDYGDICFTQKAQRGAIKGDKLLRRRQIDIAVAEAASSLLDKPGTCVRHRDVWNKLGGSANFSRDEVLDSLRRLRDDHGLLDNIKLSDNNFQILWVRRGDTPEAAGFETN